MTFTVPAMMIDRVDNRDHVIARIPRRDVFSLKANFRVVHVLVHNDAGDILLQKIAPGLRHPGAWGSSVAGYVAAGETYRKAAVRKLKEELGLQVSHLKHVGRTWMVDEGCRKFIGVYTVRHSGPFTFVPTQVSGVEFLSMREIVEAERNRSRLFTATFLCVLRYLRRSASTRARPG